MGTIILQYFYYKRKRKLWEIIRPSAIENEMTETICQCRSYFHVLSPASYRKRNDGDQ